MGYERNDRRPGGYTSDRGGFYAQDRARGQDYGRDAGDRGYGDDRGRGHRFDDDRQRYGGDPRGYDDDRGFFQRAGDEVRSWFGDEEADRRRNEDERRDGGDRGGYGMTGDAGAHGTGGANWSRERDQRHDPSYRDWRDRQMQAFDRDYEDYRRENQSRFDQEFHSWRQGRQGQRDLLGKVQEHQEVIGSDGQHVGTVDHVRGDHILLTKSDQNAGGHHHSIPSSWLQSVDDKVTLSKSADQARQHWRDEDRNNDERALFGRGGERAPRSFDRAFGR